MHWVFGLGKVTRLEERDVSGKDILYYAVQIGDMTIWVPEDDMLASRLRRPTTEGGFKKLHNILSGPGDLLPDDRHQRKILLMDILKDGSAEALCRVIRSLSTYRKARSLNENDQALLKRAEKALLGEWSVAYSITPLQAETELHRFLSKE